MTHDLPNDLNIRDFWELPDREWRNITKYDFRYILKTFNNAKHQAHLAFSDDIAKLQNGLPSSSNRFKILEACKIELKNVRKDKTNKLFWETQAEKVLKLAMNRAVNEEELTNIEQLAAIKVLKRRNTPGDECLNVAEGSGAPTQKRKSDVEHDQKKQKKTAKEESFEDTFYAFQEFAASCAATGDGISVESHIYELLALKNIILLKPSQYSPSMRRHFEDRTLQNLYNVLLQSLCGSDKCFDQSVASLISDAIYRYSKSIERKEGGLMDCARELVLLSSNRPRCEATILFGVASLLHRLPTQTMLNGVIQGETELWSSTFDSIISPMLSNPEQQVILRWSNVIPPEGSVSDIVHVRPDALLCEIDQLSWGRSLGFGEVKLSEPTVNLNALGQDLLRLADLSQRATASSNASLSFQIHGYNLTAYITKTIPDTSITAMLEITSVTFPRSVQDLPSFVCRENLDKLVRLHDVFWNNCLEKSHSENPNRSTLDIAVLNAIKQSTPDRTRSNTIRY